MALFLAQSLIFKYFVSVVCSHVFSVVVDRASAATQGSFLSAGAASDNVEISELKRKQRESIQLLPLRFKDKQAEEEFVFNSRRLMEMRSIGLFVVKVLATTCVYGVLAVSGILQISAYVPDVLNQGLHATYAALMVLAVVSVLLPVVPWIKSRLEYSLYAIFFTETIVLALFVTTQKMSAYTDKTWELNFKSRQTEPSITSTSEDLCAESPLLTVHILAVELIMDAWVQFFMYFFIITVSIVLPSRVRVAAWVQVIVLLIYCIPVFTGQVYCRILLYPECVAFFFDLHWRVRVRSIQFWRHSTRTAFMKQKCLFARRQLPFV